MTIAKTIQKPRNWQDFERLCKKLFGELWRCPSTIKANGRSGQAQQGVDIYGVPEGKQQYWGIQCKGKDDNLDSVLTAKEIDSEVARARSFQPPLETFIIATTAPKDVELEKYVRLLDVRSREEGKFAIQIFCWEDLVDLIEESRDTFNWWVREKRHRERFDVAVGFEDGTTEITVRPKFRRVTTEYVMLSELTPLERMIRGMLGPHASILGGLTLYDPTARRCLNKSWSRLGIALVNSGLEVIENYRFDFAFETVTGPEDVLKVCDPDRNVLNARHWPVCVDEDALTVQFEPVDGKPLTQGDSRFFTVAIMPSSVPRVLRLKWDLYSRDFRRSGELKIDVQPEVENVRRRRVVEAQERGRSAEVVIEEVDDEDEPDCALDDNF